MAVTKIWAVHSNVDGVAGYDVNSLKTEFDERSLADSLSLVVDPLKTVDGKLIAGVNCDPRKAAAEFNEVKENFGKTDGVLAYHGHISFSNSDRLSPVDVLSVSAEIAKEMWGDAFQVLLAVHTNTETLHAHFLVNSVSFIDGHKASDNEKNYYRLRAISDRICGKYDLIIPDPSQEEEIDYRELEKRLVEIRMKSPTVELLKANLSKEGMTYCGTEYIKLKNGKYLKLSKISPSIAKLFEYKSADVASKPELKPGKPAAAAPDLGLGKNFSYEFNRG